MKLTATQIAQIDETLVLNKVAYDDIKLELTDHIASDIEEIMKNGDVPYEVAFKQAFEKWKGMIQEGTFSLVPFMFLWKSAPKIVVDKWLKEAKKQLIYSLLFFIVTSVLIMALIKIGGREKESYKMMFEVFCKNSCVTMYFLILFGRLLMLLSKIKTTPGNLFNFFFIVYTVYGLDFSNLLNHFQLSLRPFIYSFPGALFTISHIFLSFTFLYKHFQFEKKLSKV